MKVEEKGIIDETRNRVVNLSEEKLPFAKLDKISYEIGKSFLDTPEDGFELVKRLWEEVKSRKVKPNIDILKVSAITVVLANILGILSQKDFEKVVNLIEEYNLEGSKWYIQILLLQERLKDVLGHLPIK